MFGSEEMFAALNISAITDGLSPYTFSGAEAGKAFFSSPVIPKDLPLKSKSLNFHLSPGFNPSMNVTIFPYTINCRAGTYADSKTIADKVLTAINRTSYAGHSISCQAVIPISPATDNDNFNTVIEAKIFIT